MQQLAAGMRAVPGRTTVYPNSGVLVNSSRNAGQRWMQAPHLAHDGHPRVSNGPQLAVRKVVVQHHVCVAGTCRVVVEGPQLIKVLEPGLIVHLSVGREGKEGGREGGQAAIATAAAAAAAVTTATAKLGIPQPLFD